MREYWIGAAYGTFMGFGLGYLKWKLPVHVQQYQAWWQRVQERRPKIRAEIERIEGMFRLERFVPNRLPEPFFRERVLAWWERQRLDPGGPKTPEQVAQQVYEEILARG